MPSKPTPFQQTFFGAGMAQSPLIGNESQIADCQNISLTEEYGAVTLARNSIHKNPATDVEYEATGTNYADRVRIVGNNIIGINNKKYLFLSDFSFVDKETQKIGKPTGTLKPLLFAIGVEAQQTNFFVTKATNGFDIYSFGAFSTGSNPLNNINTKQPAVEALRDVHATDSSRVTGIALDGFLYLALNNAIYRIEQVANTFVIEEKLTLPPDESISKLIPHGDYILVFTTENATRAGFTASSPLNRSFRYVWNRSTDAWEQRQEIPGFFIDAVKYDGIDLIITDREIGYFQGDVFSVIKHLPLNHLEIPLPGSAIESGNYVVFATSQFTEATEQAYGFVLQGSGIQLWTLGKQQEGNPLSLQRYTKELDGYGMYDNLFVIERSGDLSFTDTTTRIPGMVVENSGSSVQYYVATQGIPQDQTKGVLRSFIQSIHFANFREYKPSGTLDTMAIGARDATRKRVTQIALNAAVPQGGKITLYVSVDNGEYKEVGTILGHIDESIYRHPKPISAEGRLIGIKGLVECGFFQVRLVLSTEFITATPKVYSLGVFYDAVEAV